MLDSPQHNFIKTALDPDLLSAPYGIQTNWHVITGAPCSGKTTLIKRIADKGFQTVPETGRIVIEAELARGRTLEEIRENESVFQRSLLDARVKVEHSISTNDLVFLDRALPEFITFYRANGLNPNEILSECLHYRYASIFILDRLPLIRDGVRAEDDATSDFLDEWLARDYSALGYDVVRVPVFPVEERLQFIFERLSDQGLA